jgi:hypothetical protein
VSRRTHIARAPCPAADEARAFLYVEGPRDREIIEGWALRPSPRLAARVRGATIILGGRQPARACEHLARERASGGEVLGLCVLDRDQQPGREPPLLPGGPELFVWGRRHIESYLLVPSLLRRALRSPNPRALRALEAALPDAADERAWVELDAKRRLAASGERLPWGRLARAMRDDELHGDVGAFLLRLAALFGVSPA